VKLVPGLATTNVNSVCSYGPPGANGKALAWAAKQNSRICALQTSPTARELTARNRSAHREHTLGHYPFPVRDCEVCPLAWQACQCAASGDA
jgi:hypothetical protein